MRTESPSFSPCFSEEEEKSNIPIVLFIISYLKTVSVAATKSDKIPPSLATKPKSKKIK